MKNLKKFLAVLVVVAIMATTMVSAFAADALTGEAKIVADLGILKGSNGVDAAYLAKSTGRLQAAILTLRLMGKEATALAFAGEDNFKDAKDVTWVAARNVMAYLKENPEFGWKGGADGTFNPNGEATPAHIYKVILELLGYRQGIDFEWSAVMDFAAAKGLVKLKDVKTLTNNDVAIAIVEGLKATVAAGNQTLAEKFIASGFIKEADALAAGLISFKVASVSSDNMKEYTVKFSKAVSMVASTDTNWASSALNPVNYSDVAGFVSKVDKVDDKTVLVTLAAPVAVGSSVAVTVKNIKDAALATTIGTFTTSYIVVDTKAPTATASVDVTKKLTITFSEPVTSAGTVYVAGTAIAVTPDAYNKVFTATLGAAYVAGSSYEVKIIGATDLAGNYTAPNPYSITVTLATDAVLPTVSSVVPVMDGNSVLVTFSEALLDMDTTTGFNYGSIDFTNLAGVSLGNQVITAFDATNNTATVAVPGGLTVNYKYVDVKVKGYKDIVGNAGADASFRVLLEKDTVAPAVKEVKSAADNKSLIVVFTERVAITTGATITVNYTANNGIVYNAQTITAAGMVLCHADGAAATNDANDVAVKFIPSSWADTNGVLAAGTYTVKVAANSVADISGLANKNVEFSGTAAVGTVASTADTTAATVTAVYDGVRTITLTSNEDMKAITAANFTLSGVALPAGANVYFYLSFKTIKVELPYGSIDLAGVRPFAYTVYDLAGNATSGSIAPSFFENVRPTVASALMVDPTTVLLTFSENVNNVAAGDFEVYANTTTKLTVSSVSSATNTVTITLSAPVAKTDVITVKVLGTTMTDTLANPVVAADIVAK